MTPSDLRKAHRPTKPEKWGKVVKFAGIKVE